MPHSPKDRDEIFRRNPEEDDTWSDFQVHAEIEIAALKLWMQRLDHVAQDILQTGRESPSIGWFWVGLHGVLAEILPKLDFDAFNSFDAQPGDPRLENSIFKHLCSFFGRLRDACLAFRDALTEDEILLIDYERDCQCHVSRVPWRARGKGEGKSEIPDDREFKALGRRIPLAEVQRILDRQLFPVGGDEKCLAVTLAQVLAPKIHALRLALGT